VGAQSGGVQSNVPAELTSFVGRRSELRTVSRLLSGSRLLTLVGAGGIGKSRLALEVSRRTRGRYPDGTWLVELAPLSTPEFVPEVVAEALGLRLQRGSSSLDSLVNALASRELLCVLDNCEHLLAACANAVDALLKGCPRIRILATSREVLGVSYETIWRVPSMATHAVGAPATVDQLRQLDAIQLFVQRAQAARPGFELSGATAPAVARICQQLDGLPLAIELAAARCRALSVDTIEARLVDRFHLLRGGHQGASPRHQTLQSTLDWSYGLLDRGEQGLLRRLSVFRGGFTLGAAEEICADREDSSRTRTVFDRLSGLVDKSLVIFDAAVEGSSRYHLLETVREYAALRLSETEEREQICVRHADYFCASGNRIAEELRGEEPAAAIARVEQDLDNIRACLDWTLSRAAKRSLELTLALGRYWGVNGRAEGATWLARALDMVADPDETRARGLSIASRWASLRGDVEAALHYAEACLTVAQQLDSSRFRGQALGALALARVTEEADDWSEVSHRLFLEAEELLGEAGDHEALMDTLNNHGYNMYAAGRAAVGRPLLQECLCLARARRDEYEVHIVLESLASCEFSLGERTAAEAHWKEALRIAGELRSLFVARYCLVGLARIALEDRRPLRCLRLLGCALEMERRTGAPVGDVSPLQTRILSESRAEARHLVGDAAADAAWGEGARMSFQEGVRYCLESSWSAEPPSSEVPRESQPADPGTFTRDGDFWSLGFMGRVVRLRDSKGLRDIARLLASSGREIAAVDLAAADVSAAAVAGSRGASLGPGFGVEASTGSLLDAEARRQYRQRLADLEEELVGSEADHDPERAARAREEREFLLAELGAALGLGGRPRVAGDPAERARVAVTMRIRQAIGRIEVAHGELGRHLRRSIRTGAFCVYDPPSALIWRL
jgi:predicted ATPase